MVGPNRHCILQIRSYAGEAELKQSTCAIMLVVFSEFEEDACFLSCDILQLLAWSMRG